MFQQVYACCCPGHWKDCLMHCGRYHNIHCLWNSRFVPCAFDCDAERGLLLHTPTSSARPGADGLETFALLFYSSLLFQGRRLKILSAKSKATLYWPQRSFVAIADRKGWFEVTLLRSLSSIILLVRHKKHMHRVFLCIIESIKILCWGGGGKREKKRGQYRWRHSTSSLK